MSGFTDRITHCLTAAFCAPVTDTFSGAQSSNSLSPPSTKKRKTAGVPGAPPTSSSSSSSSFSSAVLSVQSAGGAVLSSPLPRRTCKKNQNSGNAASTPNVLAQAKARTGAARPPSAVVDLRVYGANSQASVGAQGAVPSDPNDLNDDDFEEDEDNCPPEDEDDEDDEEGDLECKAADLVWEEGQEIPETNTGWEEDGRARVPIQQGATPLHCFERVFPKAALVLIVTETNRHARTLQARKRRPDLKAWVDVTEEEMLKFLGCLMVWRARARILARITFPYTYTSAATHTHTHRQCR